MADETGNAGTGAGSTIAFGVGAEATIGIVQSTNNNSTAEVAEARDENGKVIAMKAYSVSKEVTVEALIASGATPPAAGTSCTLDGVTGVVTASNVTKSNTDFQKVSVTIKLSDNASVLAY